MSALIEYWSINVAETIPEDAFQIAALNAAIHVHEGEVQP